MVKFMICFRQAPDGVNAFENRYNNFLALCERIPNITRRQVVSLLGTPLYYRILELYFDDQATMEDSLKTPSGQEAGTELRLRFPKGSFDTFLAEVYEEPGGSTPQ